MKCAGSSFVLWGCIYTAGTEGLIGIEEKLNAPKYWDENLNENQVQSIQNLRGAEGLTSNRTVTLSTQQEWLIDNSVNVFELPNHCLSLNPIIYFWRNLKMCICLHPTWQSLKGEEVRRKIADNWQMLMSKACRIKQKKTWGCKGASAKYLVIFSLNTYAMYLFEFLFLINVRSCDNSVFALSIWCMWGGGGGVI